MKTTISTTYALKWRIKNHEHYMVATCGNIINMRTGRKLKRVLNNRCVGYWIAGKFYSLPTLRANIERIQRMYETPF